MRHVIFSLNEYAMICYGITPLSLTGTEFYWFVTKIPTRMQTTRGTAGVESATFQLQIRRPITITTH